MSAEYIGHQKGAIKKFVCQGWDGALVLAVKMVFFLLCPILGSFSNKCKRV